ncbi:hypothetical protein [Legionella massiliensis]|uniref:hypothetical protein n=1 Tax=Legionella massiliensis TaxID=1034943 RepID=UPI0005C36CE8|nr:hypothetical protein [Legionella massiliensis]
MQHRNHLVANDYKYDSIPQTPKDFALAMISYPHLLASANLGIYDVLSKVEDKEIVREFFKSPSLAKSATPEQRTQLTARPEEAPRYRF